MNQAFIAMFVDFAYCPVCFLKSHWYIFSLTVFPFLLVRLFVMLRGKYTIG